MKKNNGLWSIIGIGAGLVSLAGAGAGLAVAYRKAKKQDKTIKNIIRKKKSKYEDCACVNTNTADDVFDDSEKFSEEEMQEFLEGMNEYELEPILNEVEEKDLFDENNDKKDIESLKNDLNFYKNEVKRISKIIKDIENSPEKGELNNTDGQ